MFFMRGKIAKFYIDFLRIYLSCLTKLMVKPPLYIHGWESGYTNLFPQNLSSTHSNFFQNIKGLVETDLSTLGHMIPHFISPKVILKKKSTFFLLPYSNYSQEK